MNSTHRLNRTLTLHSDEHHPCLCDRLTVLQIVPGGDSVVPHARTCVTPHKTPTTPNPTALQARIYLSPLKRLGLAHAGTRHQIGISLYVTARTRKRTGKALRRQAACRA